MSMVRPIQRRSSPAFVSNGLIKFPVEGTTVMLVANFSDDPIYITRGQTLGYSEEPVELFYFEAFLRVSAFQFTRGSALYGE
jgi:hypothetical protein